MLQLHQSTNLLDMLKTTDIFRKTNNKVQQLSNTSTESNKKENNE